MNSQQNSTQVYLGLNRIEGEFRAARIHDQIISWCQNTAGSPYDPFNPQSISISCTCRYYQKATQKMDTSSKKYCSHIIGQLRRVIFMTK